ncbi:hypothetical protein NEOLEDRAFT_352043 [Neolentinus lepideus HHB14362 ss-1]|uniref:G-protein coupled receptors family 2 profile 2 domain-containing protein n=1 Tax=Neolentinus lepideus HHB14362 ss-1 TaxID=1314782 RepID=A0A165SS71_9AGAM|nr:hypothetical protein NEOLEDRAFT_352043 [Neolentinus lepideus HHB14362 ss-1]
MGNDFAFTQHLVDVSNRLWLYFSAISAIFCFVLLVVILIVFLHRPSRKFLDRVSFRIVCYSLVSNTAFGIANAVGGSFTGPTPACGLAIWILQLTLQLSSMLNFCIALNMQLVIVHSIDGRKAEKYYILGSAILALSVTIPPYAARQYGWDRPLQDCWYSNNDKHQRLAWQIGTQLFWTGAAVVGEVVSSTILLSFLYQHLMRRRRIVQTATSIVNAEASINHNSAVSSTGLLKGHHRSVDRQFDHVREYKGIILRIALYPLASCIINITSIFCVLHASFTDGVHSQVDYNILLLSDFLYGGRGLVYALLAATDPALVRAINTFVRHFIYERSRSSADHMEKGAFAQDSNKSTQSTRAVIQSTAEPCSVGTVQVNICSTPDAVAVVSRKSFSGEVSANKGRGVNVDVGVEVASTTTSVEGENDSARKSSLELEREAFQKQI